MVIKTLLWMATSASAFYHTEQWRDVASAKSIVLQDRQLQDFTCDTTSELVGFLEEAYGGEAVCTCEDLPGGAKFSCHPSCQVCSDESEERCFYIFLQFSDIPDELLWICSQLTNSVFCFGEVNDETVGGTINGEYCSSVRPCPNGSGDDIWDCRNIGHGIYDTCGGGPPQPIEGNVIWNEILDLLSFESEGASDDKVADDDDFQLIVGTECTSGLTFEEVFPGDQVMPMPASTGAPVQPPTMGPTGSPTATPSQVPITGAPIAVEEPVPVPSFSPTSNPTAGRTSAPVDDVPPTLAPSIPPVSTDEPTKQVTSVPVVAPVVVATAEPTGAPVNVPPTSEAPVGMCPSDAIPVSFSAVTQLLGDEWQQVCPDRIVFESLEDEESAAVDRVCSGVAYASVATRRAGAPLQSPIVCAESNLEVVVTDVAVDALVVLTVLGGTASKCMQILEDDGGVLLEQIRWIFSSWTETELEKEEDWSAAIAIPNSDGNPATKLWCELSSKCPCETIMTAGPPARSVAFQFMAAATGLTGAESLAHSEFNSFAQRSDLISYLDRNSAAIGYMPFRQYEPLSLLLDAVPIHNPATSITVPPLKSHLVSGDYWPYSRRVSVYASSDALGIVQPFINFAQQGDFYDGDDVMWIPLQTNSKQENNLPPMPTPPIPSPTIMQPNTSRGTMSPTSSAADPSTTSGGAAQTSLHVFLSFSVILSVCLVTK